MPEIQAKNLCVSQAVLEGIFCVLILDSNFHKHLFKKWHSLHSGKHTVHCVECNVICSLHQTKLLKKAMAMLENDKQVRKDERERTLAEKVPALQLSGLSLQDLQVNISQKNKDFLF